MNAIYAITDILLKETVTFSFTENIMNAFMRMLYPVLRC